MALAKKFKFTERVGPRYEASFANLFNHTNFGNPRTNVSTSSFGVITSLQSAEGAGPRVIQMGLRLKAYSTRGLNRAFGSSPENKWAEKGSKRYLWKPENVLHRIRYVLF